MSDFLRETFDETKRRFTDRDYMRWRMKRKLIRAGLVLLTLILLAPAIMVLKLVNAPPAAAFGVTAVGVVFLIVMYSIVGMFGKPYEPPHAASSFAPQNSPTNFGSNYAGQPVPMEPVSHSFAAKPPIAAKEPTLGQPPPFAPAEPSPVRTGGTLLAIFGGCGVAVLLSCGGLVALALFSARAQQPARFDAAPFGQPNNGFGNQPFDAQRMADEHRQRVDQMQREQQQRFEEIRKRHEDLINSNR